MSTLTLVVLTLLLRNATSANSNTEMINDHCTPPPKFTLSSGSGKHFYYFSDSPFSFHGARKHCIDNGGHDLAMPRVLAEYEFLVAEAQKQNVDEYYVGLFRFGKPCEGQDCDGRLQWVDGQSFIREQLPTDPIKAKDPGQRCFRYVRNYSRFADMGCNAKKRYACEYNCNAPVMPAVPQGVQRFGQSLFVKPYLGTQVTRDEAIETCQSEVGGHLLEPRDNESAREIHQLMATIGQRAIWLGLLSTADVSCTNVACNEKLIFASDETAFVPQSDYFTITSLLKDQPVVSAKFQFSPNTITLLSQPSITKLPFVCQYSAQCQELEVSDPSLHVPFSNSSNARIAAQFQNCSSDSSCL